MSARPLSEALVGTWSLVSRVDTTASGERRVDPLLGEDPIAMLVYDVAGHFAAQFMKRDRSTVSDTVAMPAATNNTRAVGGYDAYFGTYRVDDATSVVTQELTAALSPENVGQVVSRRMEVQDDLLTIRLDTQSVDGEPVTRTLQWTRVG